MRLERYVLPAVIALSGGAAIATGVLCDNNDNQVTTVEVSGQAVVHYPEWNNVVIHDQCNTLEIVGGIALDGALIMAVSTARRRLR